MIMMIMIMFELIISWPHDYDGYDHVRINADNRVLPHWYVGVTGNLHGPSLFHKSPGYPLPHQHTFILAMGLDNPTLNYH